MADEKGAPSDFAGRVLSNDDSVKPKWDTEGPDTDEPSKGAKFDISNAAGTAKLSTVNPPAKGANDIEPHPLAAHFAKRGGPVRKLNSAPVDVSEN